MTIDHETIEALGGEPELLAIADAVQSAGPQLGPVPAPRSPRRPVRISAAALAVAAVVGIVLASPWSSGGGPSFVDKALAAVGNRPVLHVVLRYTLGNRIDLRTGASSPAKTDLELWYDARRRVFRTEARRDGRVVYRTAGKGNLGREPFLLTTLYRQALEKANVHKLGEAVVRGRRAVVIQMHLPHGAVLRDYIDAHSFRLLRMQYFLGGRLASQEDVLRFETVSREQARLPKHPHAVSNSSSGTVTLTGSSSGSAVAGEAALRKLRTAFARPALWPGRSVDGHRLSGVRLETENSTTDGRTVHGRRVVIDYGPRLPGFDDAYLEVEELPAGSPLQRSEGIDAAPPAGFLDLASGEMTSDGNRTRTQWTGTMTGNGFTIQITSFNRATLIAAARAMRPVP